MLLAGCKKKGGQGRALAAVVPHPESKAKAVSQASSACVGDWELGCSWEMWEQGAGPGAPSTLTGLPGLIPLLLFPRHHSQPGPPSWLFHFP